MGESAKMGETLEPGRILLVEDDKETRDLIAEALGEAGYEVTSAGGMAAASAALRDADRQ